MRRRLCREAPCRQVRDAAQEKGHLQDSLKWYHKPGGRIRRFCCRIINRISGIRHRRFQPRPGSRKYCLRSYILWRNRFDIRFRYDGFARRSGRRSGRRAEGRKYANVSGSYNIVRRWVCMRTSRLTALWLFLCRMFSGNTSPRTCRTRRHRWRKVLRFL